MTVKMIQLTIAQGNSQLSPVAFVYFGNLLASQGDITEGCRYVRIAQKLIAKTGSQEMAGEVTALATQTLGYVQPLQSLVDCHKEGHDVAMAAGDIHFALLNKTMQLGVDTWTSNKLPILKQEYANARKSCEEHGHFLVWVAHIIYMEKAISMLMGTKDDTLVATESRVEKYLEKNSSASRYVYSQKMYFCFMVRDYDEMKSLAEKVFQFGSPKWALLLNRANQSFYSGLVAWWIYRETNDANWAGRGCKSKHEMKKWSESSEHNFLHRALLLEAEEAFSNMDIERAKSLYERAISSARQHR